MVIRNATSADIPALCRLELECFSCPWTEKGFADFFANACSRCLVALLDGEISGYIGMYLVGDEAEITNLAVSGVYRRRGVGESLLKAAMSLDGASRILLEVRESNLAARRLYEKYGFRIDGVRRGFYTKPREDAILMSRVLKKEIFVC